MTRPRIPVPVWLYLALVLVTLGYLWVPIGVRFQHPIGALSMIVILVLAVFVLLGSKTAWLTSLLVHMVITARVLMLRGATWSPWLDLWLALELMSGALLLAPQVRAHVGSRRSKPEIID